MASREVHVNLKIADLDHVKAIIDKLVAERDAAVARAEQAEQAVARVRELHRQLAWPNCHYDNQPWPCITIRALDGTP